METEEKVETPAVEPAKEETSLANIEQEAKHDFLKTVKRRYTEQYADAALQLMKEAKKVERSHLWYQGLIVKINAGKIEEAMEEYRKERKKLEDIDEYEIG